MLQKRCVYSGEDTNGNLTSYVRDGRGNVIKITYPDRGVEQFEYDEISRVIKQETPEGVVTEYFYDGKGRLTKTVLAGEETREVRYNEQGLVEKEIKTGYGQTSEYSYTYDAMGNRKTSTDALNNTTTYTYDNYGNVKTETLPTGAIYHYTYDGKNRVLTVSVQVGETTQLLKEYTYTNLGTQLQVEETVHGDATTRHTTTYRYDYLGRLVKQTNPDGGVLTWNYRTDGLLASETDALSGTTYFQSADFNALLLKQIFVAKEVRFYALQTKKSLTAPCFIGIIKLRCFA